MIYPETVKARFITRLNRFEAVVGTESGEETVHVKNTGRCRELLLPGCDVILAKSHNPGRKTAFDLIAVCKAGRGWINILHCVELFQSPKLYSTFLLWMLSELYENLPEAGDEVTAGEAFADVESVKAVSDVMSPVSGIICAINEDLLDAPEKLNEAPYDAWMIKVENITDTEELLDAAEYEAFCATEEA